MFDSHKDDRQSPVKRRRFSDARKIQFVRDWEQSAETKLVHARKAGVHVATFCTWVRKFGTKPSRPSPVFIPAELVSSPTTPQSLKIQLPGGASIMAGPSSNLDTLVLLLRKLEASGC